MRKKRSYGEEQRSANTTRGTTSARQPRGIGCGIAEAIPEDGTLQRSQGFILSATDTLSGSQRVDHQWRDCPGSKEVLLGEAATFTTLSTICYTVELPRESVSKHPEAAYLASAWNSLPPSFSSVWLKPLIPSPESVPVRAWMSARWMQSARCFVRSSGSWMLLPKHQSDAADYAEIIYRSLREARHSLRHCHGRGYTPLRTQETVKIRPATTPSTNSHKNSTWLLGVPHTSKRSRR